MEYVPLAPLLTALGVMLALSLVVERALSVFAWIINRIIMIKSAASAVTAPIEQRLVADKRALEDEALLRGVEAKATSGASEIDAHPRYALPPSRFDVKHYEIQDPNAVLKSFWLQLLGVIIGICGCWYAKFSAWILVGPHVEQGPEWYSWWEYALTGLIIGAGSKPVNTLMNFLVNRKIIIKRKEVSQGVVDPQPPRLVMEKPVAVSSAAVSVALVTTQASIEHIIGFRYDGGNRPERLQYSHEWPKDIRLDAIVYHHTAMHCDSPFEEIVREFDRKGWLTGYHTVVFKDGSIRVLCRWDRMGNHTVGHNQHSLGIAFHGNFETDPKVPFANFDGRFGMPYPSENQIDAGARIVALWHLLYGIKTDFKTAIVPHFHLNPQKACPGKNFPRGLLESRIKYYADLWKTDRDFKDAVGMFKLAPMVMRRRTP